MTLEADLAAASDPSTSAEELVRLSSSRSTRVRRAVAENVAAPKEVLARLFRPFPKEVVTNPASALFNLGPGGTWDWIPQLARMDAAERKNASPIVLQALASDADWLVRERVAKNANTPVPVLEAFASDPVWMVREEVAKNANTPVAVLQALASDVYWSVRASAKVRLP